jgi:hypothetical protein
MPIRSRLAAGTGVVAIAAALALVGSAPASAHSGQFFTNAASGESGGFATISQTDAGITLLPDLSGQYASAVEIYNEVGYAIAGGGEQTGTLYFWDHTTGAVTDSRPLTLDPEFSDVAFIVEVFALDTTKGSTLPDGTLLTIVRINFDDEEINEGIWLSSIDPTTGIVSPLLDLTGYVNDFDLFLHVDSLATDPMTGITYLLTDFDDGTPLYSAVDFVGGTVADPVALPGVQDVLGDGYILGADFTDVGVLFFFYTLGGEGSEDVFASLTGAITANPSAVAIGAVDDDAVSTRALAYDPAPRLADTGANLVNPAIAALALLGFGAAVVIVSRHRRVTAA